MSEGAFRLYILRCADGSLYTGIASDLERRLKEHSGSRRGAKYLRGRSPFKLVFSCDAGTRDAAQRLEHRVKRLSRCDKERLLDGRIAIDELRDDVGICDQASGVTTSG